MAILDEILALKPEDKAKLFAAIAPEFAADAYARAADAQYMGLRAATQKALDAVATALETRKATFDGTQKILTAEEVAVAVATITAEAAKVAVATTAAVEPKV